MINANDRKIIRDLAKRYLEICNDPEQSVKRELWRRHNSFEKTQIPIYIRAFAWSEMPDSKCLCVDKFLCVYENFFRESIFRSSFDDDFIFEPWVTLIAANKCYGWGVPMEHHHPDSKDHTLTAYKDEYPLKDLSDFEKLKMPWHEIDEKETAIWTNVILEAIGDIITVNIDRGSVFRMFTGDISSSIGHLRGIENIMLDIYDNPEWLHRLLAFMRDGILRAHDEAEKNGDWGLCTHHNQAMPYAKDLQDPAPNVNGVKRKQLWAYMASEEYTLISPQMQEEFLLQYQLPILEKFGLTAYGCCEDLTNKINMLRQIPNLRRIAASPFANVAKCAEQIGSDYILSYRPSPADMVSYDFNTDRIRNTIRHDLEICRKNGCCVDITLKDVETVQYDADRIRRWTKITREIAEEF